MRVVPLLRALAHRAADAPVQVTHQLLEDRLLRVEVEVVRAGRDTCRLRELHDRRLVVPELAEDALGGVEQAAPRVEPATRKGTTVDVGDDGVGHAVTSGRSSVLLDLPHRVARQLVDEHDALRHLEAGKPVAAEVARRRPRRVSRSATTNATPTSPHISSGTPTTATSCYGGMLVQHRLDLGGIDVLAARDEHLLQPALDPEVALLVSLDDVARVQPSVPRASWLSPRGCASSPGTRSARGRAARPRAPISTSTNGYGLPAEPILRIASSGGRQSTFGDASVRP